jgi:hypothetical protein
MTAPYLSLRDRYLPQPGEVTADYLVGLWKFGKP